MSDFTSLARIESLLEQLVGFAEEEAKGKQPLLRLKEASQLLGISQSKLSDAVNRGDIPGYREKRTIRVNPVEAKECMKQNQEAYVAPMRVYRENYRKKAV